MSSIRVFKAEFRGNRGWFIGWLLGINVYGIMALGTYPGKEGMGDLLILLEDENFAAFIGDFGDSDPGFALWLSLMSSFFVVLILMLSVMTGVLVAEKSVNDHTGELIHTLPIGRSRLLLIRAMSGLTIIAIIILSWLIPLGLPLIPESIPQERLLKIFVWGTLFGLAGLVTGMVIGSIAANNEKGLQFALLIVLFFYIMQIITALRSELTELSRINLLTWFAPDQVFLFNKVNEDSMLKLSLYTLGVGYLALWLFEGKDLVKEVGRPLPLPRLNRSNKSVANSSKSGRTSIFSRWARPLEKRYPFTADFIYSEHRVLLIMFIAIVMIWPLQLILYPGDEATQTTISGFGNSGLIRLVVYGYDLSERPYVWWVVSQAIGGHWLIYLPLMFYWVKKSVLRDATGITGEIMASSPVKPERVMLERMFAMILELTLLTFVSIVFLVLSELVTGQTETLFWEVLATLPQIIFYYMLLVIGVILGLIWQGKGTKVAQGFLLGSFILFAISILGNDYGQWYIKGLWGLFDPVAIILEENIFANNYGVVSILILAMIGSRIVILLSPRFSWVIIYTRSQSSVTDIEKNFD